MIEASAQGVVHAAPADVYALLTDPEPAARRTELPNGATVDTERTVLERIENRRLVVEGVIRPFGPAPTRRLRFGRAVARLERTLEPHPYGTLVAVRMQVRVSPLPLRLWFAVFKRGQWQRGVDEALTRLVDAF